MLRKISTRIQISLSQRSRCLYFGEDFLHLQCNKMPIAQNFSFLVVFFFSSSGGEQMVLKNPFLSPLMCICAAAEMATIKKIQITTGVVPAAA